MAELANNTNNSLPSNPEQTIPAASTSSSSFQTDFVWDWYIRIKLQVPPTSNLDIIDELSAEVQRLWHEIQFIIGESESHLWPEILQDPSKSYFWFIGLPNLPSPKVASCKECLREWQKNMKHKGDGKSGSIDARFIPRKVFVELKLVVYQPSKPRTGSLRDGSLEPQLAGAEEQGKGKTGRAEPKPTNFKKIKGSNPQQIQRQFLQHNMQNTTSSSNTNTTSSTKLRLGKEVLNQLKFDESYDTADYVVGHIDRKAGILEVSVDEWTEYGEDDLMAYVKYVKDGRVVWDKVRRVDLVSGKKGS